MQAGPVELDAVPPVLLGLVLGQVCLTEQVLRAVQGGGVDGHADTGGDLHIPPRNGEGILECLMDPGGRLERLGGLLEPLQQHRELVPAQAGQHVAIAQDPADPVSHLDQEFVARLVTERVVDHLEPVEVEEDHTDNATVPTGLTHHPPEGIHEGHPIGRSGQVVAEGDLAELGVQIPKLLVGLGILFTQAELAQHHRVDLLMEADHYHEEDRHRQAQHLGGTVMRREQYHIDGHEQGQLEREEVGATRRGTDRIGRRHADQKDEVEGSQLVVVRRRKDKQWKGRPAEPGHGSRDGTVDPASHRHPTSPAPQIYLRAAHRDGSGNRGGDCPPDHQGKGDSVPEDDHQQGGRYRSGKSRPVGRPIDLVGAGQSDLVADLLAPAPHPGIIG